jgi:hypothetical protein
LHGGRIISPVKECNHPPPLRTKGQVTCSSGFAPATAFSISANLGYQYGEVESTAGSSTLTIIANALWSARPLGVDGRGRIPCVGRDWQRSSCKGSCNELRDTTATYAPTDQRKRNGETPEISVLLGLQARLAPGERPAAVGGDDPVRTQLAFGALGRLVADPGDPAAFADQAGHLGFPGRRPLRTYSVISSDGIPPSPILSSVRPSLS